MCNLRHLSLFPSYPYFTKFNIFRTFNFGVIKEISPMTRLSIITVNFNNAKGLDKTIRSVKNQTYSGFEYIVIDGGSTDDSLSVIKEHSQNITYWVSEPDRGIFHAMNKGIMASNGEYLQFLNSGDCFASELVLKQIFEVGLNADILYGDVYYEFSDGRFEPARIGNEETITLAYFYRHMFPHQASFISRKLFTIDLYDENLKIIADWKFFIDRIIMKNCSIKKLNFPVVNYDMSGISSQSKYLALHQNEKQIVLNQLLPPRIAVDYEKMISAYESPVLKHLPYLNKTTGFHIFISKLVESFIKAHKLFKDPDKKLKKS